MMLGNDFHKLIKECEDYPGSLEEHDPPFLKQPEQIFFVFPEKMDGIIFEPDGDFYPDENDNSSAKASAAFDYNNRINDLFDEYRLFLYAILQTKNAYTKFLEDYVHIRHAFLTEKESAQQFASFMKIRPRREFSYKSFRNRSRCLFLM